MSTLNTAFTSVGIGGAVQVPSGVRLSYSVSGTFVGAWQLQRSLDQGQSWVVLASGTGVKSATELAIDTQGSSFAMIRMRCSAYTSGTINTVVSDLVAGSPEFDLIAPVSDGIGGMLYWTGSTWTVLPVGADTQVLTLAGGVPGWADAPAGLPVPTPQNEKQTLVFSVPIGDVDSGTYTLEFDGQTTAILNAGDGGIFIQGALEALSNIDGGNVTVSNAASPVVEFVGTLASASQPLITVASNTLTASAVPVTITPTETQAGGAPSGQFAMWTGSGWAAVGPFTSNQVLQGGGDGPPFGVSGGSEGNVLTLQSGSPQWVAPGGGGGIGVFETDLAITPDPITGDCTAITAIGGIKGILLMYGNDAGGNLGVKQFAGKIFTEADADAQILTGFATNVCITAAGEISVRSVGGDGFFNTFAPPITMRIVYLK